MCIDQDSWHLNVSLAGRHFCLIQLPSTMSEAEAQIRSDIIQKTFGPDYRLTLTRWEMRGYAINF